MRRVDALQEFTVTFEEFEAVTPCPACHAGRLTITNRRGLLIGDAVLALDCSHCGLFQHAVKAKGGSDVA